MRMSGTRRSRALFSASFLILGSSTVRAAPDPRHGYEVVLRQTSTCVLCHAGPFPNAHLQGNVGPDLHGVGARLSAGEIRARLVNAAALNPETVMPSFGEVGPRVREGMAWRGKPILSPDEIEDAVAYLAGLK